MWLPAPGERIAKYRLERLLGAGGMGAVYLARDLELDRDVALKFISDDRAADPAARRRLIREARAAAALDHPNICGVHDVLTDPEGRTCIVMQYVEGETLAERLRRGPLEARAALGMASDIAAALAEAHKRAIIHRDIKPQNIIITPSGRAKLLDFGIARLDEPTVHDQTTATKLTGPEHIVGTPAYMSPEQAQQKPLDGRSDLFSLGAVLYECLTGRLPFDGRTTAELYGQLLHLNPPAASSIRPGLTEREDELCRRLLAKHPDDRFASAEELLGALRLLVPVTTRSGDSGTVSRSVSADRPSPSVHARIGRYRWQLAVLVIALAAAPAFWYWQRPRPLPEPPADAARWYARGTELLRDGAYHSARLALQEAVALYPEYALAYGRIAEAHAELDESDDAQTALLKVDQLVENRARLAPEDRLRLDAVRALILRDANAAVSAYTEVTQRRPADAGAWLDLGRAQEAAGRAADARASYDRAIAVDASYAAAHLRRAVLLAQQRSLEDATRGFAEAERLYRAASNVEGETETLLRRGVLLNSLGKLDEARETSERARTLAAGLRSRAQEVRARLRLGAITASQGRFGDAEAMVTDALAIASHDGLEATVAEGLVELSGTLIRRQRREEADAHLARAIQLAEKRGAHRTLTRARVQRASGLLGLNRPEEALALARQGVESARQRHHRQYELIGLAVIARAHEDLGQYDEAGSVSEELLRTATAAGDEKLIGEATQNLATRALAVGDFPSALDHVTRLEEMHRRQRNLSSLAFNLTDAAEVLILLGRGDEADRPLQEVEAGAAAGNEAYRGRVRRVILLRASRAVIHGHYGSAVTLAREVLRLADRPDGNSDLANALLRHAMARMQGRMPPAAPLSGLASPALSRELRFTELATQLAAGNAAGVLPGVDRELGTSVPSYELEWRLAALGAAAARRLKDSAKAAELSARANHALARLRAKWKDAAPAYEARPDLVLLRREAGLTPQS